MKWTYGNPDHAAEIEAAARQCGNDYRYIAQHFSRSLWRVALSGEAVVGYLEWKRRGKFAVIRNLGVIHDCRRLGCATMLVRSLMSRPTRMLLKDESRHDIAMGLPFDSYDPGGRYSARANMIAYRVALEKLACPGTGSGEHHLQVDIHDAQYRFCEIPEFAAYRFAVEAVSQELKCVCTVWHGGELKQTLSSPR